MFPATIEEKIKTHFICNNFFSPENHVVCGSMLEHVVEPDSPRVTIRRMRTDTH
jgi:hypothetical protein